MQGQSGGSRERLPEFHPPARQDEGTHCHLRINCPSLLNGDGLWPEYETAAFERSDHPPYLKVVKSLATLSRQLHGHTKMENLFKWNAANLHYLVVEPDPVADHEMPLGWGLLVRDRHRLDLRLRPKFKAIAEETRLAFLHRVAASGTKATNREAGVDYSAIDANGAGSVRQSSARGALK